ncbi:hypothetical protein [Mesorhizobium ciceri]|uniref:hypothetical protein n=1 Tax=Mesorhizobium TaxID=68287 RepID=UPI00047B928E|nr:hypothetical protein [Mesorhizobium ciceri]
MMIVDPYRARALAPVTVSYVGSTAVLSTTDTESMPGVPIGPAAGDRTVFHIVHWYSSAVAPLASATIGGVTAKVHVSNGATAAGAAFLGSAIVSALVPSGTTATVVLNFATGATFHNINLATYSVRGLVSDTAIDTISDNPNAVASYAGAVDVQQDGLMLFGAVCYSSNTGYTISGATQDYTIQIGTGSPGFYSAGSSLAASATQANRPVGITPVGGFAFSGTVVSASFR